jgi:hypothetical protein
MNFRGNPDIHSVQQRTSEQSLSMRESGQTRLITFEG